MAKYPNKTSLPTAVTNTTVIPIEDQHVTTADFMQLNVSKYLKLAPKTNIKRLVHRYFNRLAPMPVPTFGKAKVHHRAFFVPFRLVMPAFTDMINDVAHVDSQGNTGQITETHTIKNSTFVEFFKMFVCSYVNEEFEFRYGAPVDDRTRTIIDNSDFVAISTFNIEDVRVTAYNLTPFGRQAMKIVNSLGIKIDFNDNNPEFYHDAMPLLCLSKAYLDWYYPSAYVQDGDAARVTALFNHDDNRVPFYDHINKADLLFLFRLISHVCYDSDYFTSAWDDPAGPNNESASDFQINDPTLQDNMPIESNVSEGNTPQFSGVLTQFALSALRSLSDYMKRHQLVGARSLDRYLSRWGITLSPEKLKRSIYIKGNNEYIRFGDVTSLADTEGAPLAAYAGKGICSSENEYSYYTDEHGMFFILSSIVPATAYYQGQDRSTMYIGKLDYYTPEFDNLGVQALSKREIFCPLNALLQYGFTTDEDGNRIYKIPENPQSINYNQEVWGFVPRYAEYKRGWDLMTGDYSLGSKNTGQEAWTLFRDVSPDFADGVLENYHDKNFLLANGEQYNRIFYVTNNEVDHFNIVNDFEYDIVFPGKSLYDNYDFKNEDSAERVSVDINGVKAN